MRLYIILLLFERLIYLSTFELQRIFVAFSSKPLSQRVWIRPSSARTLAHLRLKRFDPSPLDQELRSDPCCRRGRVADPELNLNR